MSLSQQMPAERRRFEPGLLEATAPEAGVYLLRVETLNTDSDHEHFSAIDVEVGKAPEPGGRAASR